MTPTAPNLVALRGQLDDARLRFYRTFEDVATDNTERLDDAIAFRDVLRLAIQEEVDRPTYLDLDELRAMLLEADIEVRQNDPVSTESSTRLDDARTGYIIATEAYLQCPSGGLLSDLALARAQAANRYRSRVQEMLRLVDTGSSEVPVLQTMAAQLDKIITETNRHVNTEAAV